MSFRQPPRGAAKAVNCCEGNDEDCERLAVKIDEEACLTWEFPSNYPIRQYQVSIVKEALLKNTLVCLPTGLGKTLIAAVLMHNYFRWFPTGQIIFMAPTRPLVGQQIEACHKVVGIPETATAELSGSTASEDRRRLWRDRRVFYCTPQTVSNDLKTGVLDPRRVVLVVFDEAHRALKKYAYCEVLNLIAARQCHFRVLALSATPGSTADGAQAVIDNLRISNVEMRTEDDAEVAPHTHARLVEKVFCDETEASGGRALGDALAKLAEPCVSRLFKYAERKQAGVNYADFVLAQKLLAAHDSLKTFGQCSALKILEGMLTIAQSVRERLQKAEAVASGDRSIARVAESDLFKETVEKMRGSKAEHPKTTALRELLVDHFARAHQAGASSRAMVFTGTRDSVDEIALALEGSPLLFVQKFVGQGGAEGMKQTVQRAAVAEFQRGSTNVMVATCIAEEGLDIAAVDICVFYDQVGSPIRLVQRMGRTARQRTGRVVMLMVRGEEKKLDSSRKKSASVAAFLCSDAASGNGIKLHANLSKRMIPRRLVNGWPLMVQRELAIDAWRSSQVGGCTTTKGAQAKQGVREQRGEAAYPLGLSWRLSTEEQAALDATAGGAVKYQPRLGEAWRRNVKRLRAAAVPGDRVGDAVPQPSARSRALRAAADFFQHRRWEKLYDAATTDDPATTALSPTASRPLVLERFEYGRADGAVEAARPQRRAAPPAPPRAAKQPRTTAAALKPGSESESDPDLECVPQPYYLGTDDGTDDSGDEQPRDDPWGWDADDAAAAAPRPSKQPARRRPEAPANWTCLTCLGENPPTDAVCRECAGMSGRRFPREDGGAAAGVASPRAEASRRPPAPSPRPRRDDGNAGPRAPAPVSVDAGSPRGPEAASAENPPISNGAATSPRSPSPRSLADRRDSAVPRTPQGTRGSPHAGGLATQRYRGDSCDSERSVLTQPFQGGSPRPSPPRPPPPPPASPPPPSPQRAPKTDLKTPTHPPNPPTQSASLTDAQRLRIEASKQRALEMRAKRKMALTQQPAATARFGVEDAARTTVSTQQPAASRVGEVDAEQGAPQAPRGTHSGEPDAKRPALSPQPAANANHGGGGWRKVSDNKPPISEEAAERTRRSKERALKVKAEKAAEKAALLAAQS